MSYDLMVFETSAAPSARGDFLTWYGQQTQWSEGHSYDDPQVSSPALQGWFFDMIQHYPAMNGPHASDADDDLKVSDYCVGSFAIYVGFAWSQANNAYRTMFDMARKHGVGFFDVSADDGEVWVPVSGGYQCIHGTGCSIERPGTVRFIEIPGIVKP